MERRCGTRRSAATWATPLQSFARSPTARDDILTEAAGIEAGWWYASPATHAGYELVAAGMLIMAGGHEGKPLDFDALERWTRVG